MESHGHFLQLQGQGDQTVDALRNGDLASADLPENERALLAVVETITRHAYQVTDEDIQGLRDVGWTEPQIAEMVYVTALFAFFNRVADGFGIVSQGYREGRVTASPKY